MENLISKVAALLMYQGPNISEVISKAIKEEQEYEIITENQCMKLCVTSILPYNINTQDIYYYNIDGDLIKQILITNGKEKLVFDKYKEAEQMLNKLENREAFVS